MAWWLGLWGDKQLAQLLAGAIKPGFDPPFRATGNLANLPVRELLEVVQQQRDAKIVWQPGNGGAEVSQGFLLRNDVIG